MATAWQDRFTPLANVNNGNELENGDTALTEHINVALENGAYAKKKTDENASDISSIKNRTTNLEGRTSALETKVTTLEGKHLYRHDVTMSGIFTFLGNNANFKIYTTLYTPSQYSITGINDLAQYISYLGTEIMANGYVISSYIGRYYFNIISATIRYSAQNIIAFDFIYNYTSSDQRIETGFFDQATFVDRITQIL